jgi:Mg2+-importing ATPase
MEFFSQAAGELVRSLHSDPNGLTSEDVRQRQAKYGPNLLKPKHRSNSFLLLLRQFISPLVLILIVASIMSFFLGDRTNSLIILAIVVVSGCLGFWQEKGAADAVDKLLAIVQTKAMVRRDRREFEVPVEELVPGDIVILNAGDLIPGDSALIESKDLYVNEAPLTGETFPVEKSAGVLPEGTPLAQRTNSLFMGTHVVSGDATALVVKTGKESEFGKVSARLEQRQPETEFERGVRRFGYLLINVTLLLVLAIFAINIYFNRPPLEAFLFALALAVGLTPQLLPAIISVNLAQGARRMAAKKVIVKRLASIENFGSMNVLCADKTGTLTEGKIVFRSALTVNQVNSPKAKLYAFLNSSFETGFTNPIDEAIRTCSERPDITSYTKVDEVPYDFERKRLSIVVAKDSQCTVIVKGALENILNICSTVECEEGKLETITLAHKKEVLRHFVELSHHGFKIIGLAYKPTGASAFTKEQETDLTFLGYLVFFDPPKADAGRTIADLSKLGVTLKIITGDSELVAAFVSHQVGNLHPRILKGSDLHAMSNEALQEKVNETDIFAEIEPNHKERIVAALRRSGNVVGYIGDGINDVSALHTADVGISVNEAVDVAKEAADIVLLETDLEVLTDGVRGGRATFANTLKYVFMATSANFGNMFSMAGVSLFLPFLPLLPKQILLTNLLTDLPEMTIATDSIDRELIEKPRKWDLRYIRNFMLVFGPLSSVFDFATFGVLFFFLHANVAQFRTGWFLESVVSAAFIVLVVRTRRPFWQSRPSPYLIAATGLVIAATLLLPVINLGGLFEFGPLPLSFIGALALIVLAYGASAEITKWSFYRLIRS